MASTAIQAVAIRGHEDRPTPKAHVVYKIDIQASVRSWSMWRRYSEFVDLHTELTKSTGSSPPAALPPKRSIMGLFHTRDQAILQERQVALEAYLRAILSAKEAKWREHFSFLEFLGVPFRKKGDAAETAPGTFSSSSWLDEHLALQNRIRDIRADINRRDALSDQGDVSASHTTNVQAKKTLAETLGRVRTLTRGLQELAMTGMIEGELQRRTDMVGRLQDDCEKLGRMVTIARQGSRGYPESGAVSGTTFDKGPATSSGFAKPAGRVFGAAAKPQETEVTRPLDGQGLLQLQKQQMDEQDSQVSQLTTILQRQKHLGMAIGSELESQIEMLDDLSNNVDRVGDKLGAAKKQLNRLG
ncbi:Phox-like protein [Athelia psychrophila]|uniref:Phox-like protein n=1 Tax=Athelia psychrophila TaxID=1759441 RepID=A0A166U3V9_9AGAM|nr:Phox-like protein [Fibularhizoctonia sp. CBS 109695]